VQARRPSLPARGRDGVPGPQPLIRRGPRWPAIVTGGRRRLPVRRAPAPAGAWSNGKGDGYGTHDWIIDEGLRVLSDVDVSWFHRTTALVVSDDPDNVEVVADPSKKIDHIYRDGGIRGGAVQRITEHYAKAVELHHAGVEAREAGDEVAADAAFDDASREVGLLAHFLGDLLQPYHTNIDGAGLNDEHLDYELLVQALTRWPDSAPEWRSANRTPKLLANVRRTALNAASFSRGWYDQVHDSMKASPGALTQVGRDATKVLLQRAADDMANVIWSITNETGVAPAVKSIDASLRWRGVKTDETGERLSVRALDVNGNPMEGLGIRVAWTRGDGTVATRTLWTDGTGRAGWNGPVGTSSFMLQRTVKVAATASLVTVRKSLWFYVTRRLDRGSAGFRTRVSDDTVVVGQDASVVTKATDTKGRPVRRLLVTWTWTAGTTTIARTSGYTDAEGRARSTLPITDETTRDSITVTARTSAASIDRVSSDTLSRDD
jgi:hypothetical protein